jgi:hypothetical protein
MTVQVDSARPSATGDLPFMLDGALVAQRFGVTATRMRELMSRRMVQSRVEKGEDDDAGRWRVTLRLGNRLWRGVFTADGQLCDETAGLAGPEAQHG